jgi:hypothetical protein
MGLWSLPSALHALKIINWSLNIKQGLQSIVELHLQKNGEANITKEQ